MKYTPFTVLTTQKVLHLEALYLLELLFALPILPFLRLKQSSELFLLLSQDVLLKLLFLCCRTLNL